MHKLKQVIVIRKDLNMRKGKMCSQAAHASVNVVLNLLNIGKSDLISNWLSQGGTKITVSSSSEEELKQLYNRAEESKIPCSLVIDEGRTEFHGKYTITAIAIGPYMEDDINKITGNLPLL